MTPNPDRTPEAAAFREEVAHEAQAEQALDRIAREVGEGEASDVPLPPVPDDLRSRWEERYGAPQVGEAKSGQVGKKTAVQRKGWMAWLSSAPAWGGVFAVVALTLFLMPKGGGPLDMAEPMSDGMVLRGGADEAGLGTGPVFVVGSPGFDLVAFREVAEGLEIVEVTSVADALKRAQSGYFESAYLLDPKDGKASVLLKVETGAGAQFRLDPVAVEVDGLDPHDWSDALDDLRVEGGE